MKKTDPNSVEKRIREIAAEISSITEFAEGSIANSRKQYALKDGTVRRASPPVQVPDEGWTGQAGLQVRAAVRRRPGEGTDRERAQVPQA